MIDRKQMKAAEHVDRALAAGAAAINEGAFLVEVIEGGVAKVKTVASPAGTEKIAGVAFLPYFNPTDAVDNEQFTVPASGSLIFNLRYSGGVASSARAAVVGGSDLTVDGSSFGSTPSTGTVKWDAAGGRIKFAAGDAGKVVQFIYRHALSVVQSEQRYGERHINNRNLVNKMGMVSVLKGYIEISTSEFDSSVDWSTAGGANLIVLGDDGKITIDTSGVVIPGAQVLAVPDLSGTINGGLLRISALIP